MFFVMVHYAFSATWSVSIRRIMENTIMLIPLFTLPFLPIIFGMEKNYLNGFQITIIGKHMILRLII